MNTKVCSVASIYFAIGSSLLISEGLSTKATSTDEGRVTGTFCSKTVFTLSPRTLSDIEIDVSEKGLDFSPVQRSFNQPELRKDFEEFARNIKWNCIK